MSPGHDESPDRLQDAVKRFILSGDLVRKNGLILAAVSGGPDSMAMLSILHDLTGELCIRVAVGHFDHQLRPGSADERHLVEDYATARSLPFHCGEEDVGVLAESTGDSLEEAARKARYRWLHGVADQIRADHIATGHTRSDQVETVLMRIIRGTGIRGLAGIPQKRGRIIRPLLGVDRGEILSYCASKELPFTEDPSNNDRRYFRNQIRLDLLPHLSSSYHPAIADNIVRLAQNAQTVVSVIRVDTDPIIASDLTTISPNQWILNTRQIGLLDDTSIVILFGDLFADELSCDMDFTHAHYEQLVRLVRDTGASGRMLSLPALTVKKEYEDLVITRSVQDAACGVSSDDCTTLSLPGTTRTADVEIKIEILDRSSLDDMSIESSPSHACLDRATLTPPLTVRRPLPGDRMQPFGMTGTKKLSDIFIDKKIPARARATSLVITDANGILWLVGVTVAERSRVGSGTREVVKIHVNMLRRNRKDRPLQ